jgi:hypothetical protein
MYELTNLDRNIEYIKIYGLQRSGTNFISHLINENFPTAKALVNLGGWKHGHYFVPWAMGEELHCLTIVKNPYAWLVYNYWGPHRKMNMGPELQGVPFEDFVKHKIFIEKQKHVPFLFRAINPVQHWNDMNFHWMSVRMNAKCMFVLPYEMTLSQPENVIKHISQKFNIKPIEKSVVSADKTFMPSGENIKFDTESFDKEYYKNKEYMTSYTPELLEFVNGQLDLDLMIRLGYPIIKPEELGK